MAVKNSGGSTFLAFAKSTGIFFVGNSMSKVITLLLIPLYTNTLPAADYGYFDLSVTCATLLTSFLYCDIWSSVMRLMRDDLKGEAPWKVVASGWVVFAGSTVLYIAIAIALSCFFDVPSLGLIILYGVTTNIQSMFSGIARGKGNNTDFAASGVLCTVVNVGLNLLLILAFGIGYEALYVSYAAGFSAQCLFLFLRLGMWRHVSMPDVRQVKELFVYSAPLGINSVAYWLLTSLSRVVVASTLSLAANGAFAIGSKFGSTIALATTCFTLAWQDIAFTKEIRPGSFYSNAVTQYAGFLMSCTALLLPIISLLFPVLVAGDYGDAYSVVPSFLWIAVVSAVSTFIGNIFYVIKDTKTIGATMAVSCIVNVVLVYPMTMGLGCVGANLSVLAAFVVNIAIRVFVLGRKIGLQINLSRCLLPFALLVFCSAAYLLGGTASNLTALCVSVAGLSFLYRSKASLLASSLISKFRRR